jgi:hypothetical protein
MTGTMSAKPIRLINLFKYYKALPHQNAAIEDLEDEINALDPSILQRNSEWYNTWVSAPAAKPAVFDNSWDGIYNCAKEAGAKFPECVAAQWALESAWGEHTSGRNNYFGIKGKGTIKTTWEDYGNGPVVIKDEFKDFNTPMDCVVDLVNKWYKDYRTYKGVNRALTAEQCATLLKVEGYATDPNYSSKLISIMRRQQKLE